MTQVAQLTLDVAALVKRHRAHGIATQEVIAQFAGEPRLRVAKTLDNLRQRGSIHRRTSHDLPRWYPGEDVDHDGGGEALKKALRRARQADLTNPLVFYGERIPAPRAASVWAYASHFQEQRL